SIFRQAGGRAIKGRTSSHLLVRAAFLAAGCHAAPTELGLVGWPKSINIPRLTALCDLRGSCRSAFQQRKFDHLPRRLAPLAAAPHATQRIASPHLPCRSY